MVRLPLLWLFELLLSSYSGSLLLCLAKGADSNLEPIQKWSFARFLRYVKKNNPRNITYMPVVIFFNMS